MALGSPLPLSPRHHRAFFDYSLLPLLQHSKYPCRRPVSSLVTSPALSAWPGHILRKLFAQPLPTQACKPANLLVLLRIVALSHCCFLICPPLPVKTLNPLLFITSCTSCYKLSIKEKTADISTSTIKNHHPGSPASPASSARPYLRWHPSHPVSVRTHTHTDTPVQLRRASRLHVVTVHLTLPP